MTMVSKKNGFNLNHYLHFIFRMLYGVSFVCFLNGCEGEGYAPVVDSSWQASRGQIAGTKYLVKPGDTLYSIAFRYDSDFRTLAAINRIPPPYKLVAGQAIIVRYPQVSVRRQPQSVSQVAKDKPFISQQYSWNQPKVFSQVSRPRSRNGWYWPLEGRVIGLFAPASGKKGINIAGNRGDKIRAAKGGIVAYAGNGLTGYGNLLIIKHDNQYLTAYGHNSRNLVKEGQRIQAGQVIAEIGMIDRRLYAVHFEIRREGHPMNPLQILPR